MSELLPHGIDGWRDSVGSLQRGLDDSTTVVLALGLLFAGLALTIGGHTYLRATGRRFRLRELLGSALQTLWAMPVIAVAVLIGVRMMQGLDSREHGRQPLVSSSFVDANVADVHHVHELDRDGEPMRLSWIELSRLDEPDRSLFTVSSRQFATVEEAEDDALQRASALLGEHLRAVEPAFVHAGVLPIEAVRQVAVRRRYVEPIVRHTETAEFTVHRVHLQVELSDDVQYGLQPFWRPSLVVDRLWSLGAITGFLTLTFGTLAIYLRLNELSGGTRRTRLRFAAASLVTAGGLIAAVFV